MISSIKYSSILKRTTSRITLINKQQSILPVIKQSIYSKNKFDTRQKQCQTIHIDKQICSLPTNCNKLSILKQSSLLKSQDLNRLNRSSMNVSFKQNKQCKAKLGHKRSTTISNKLDEYQFNSNTNKDLNLSLHNERISKRENKENINNIQNNTIKNLQIYQQTKQSNYNNLKLNFIPNQSSKLLSPQIIRKDKNQATSSIFYRVSTGRAKLQDISTRLEFTYAVKRIQNLFHAETQIIAPQQFLPPSSRHRSSINELKKCIVQAIPKKVIKQQIQSILQIYSLKQRPYLQSYDEIKQKKQILKNQNKKYGDRWSGIFLSSKKNKKLQKHHFNSFLLRQVSDRSANQHKRYNRQEKLTFYKQNIIFQKVQKHLILKTYTAKLFYHHLTAELCIQLGNLQKALLNLYFCEYYSRKVDLNEYVIPCLILQAQIKQSTSQNQQAIKILKTALQFSLVKKFKQQQYRILQKISMIYYYNGNSYMSRYYGQLSLNGLPLEEAELYIHEYSKKQELRVLQHKFFSIPYEQLRKKKNNQNFQKDISKDLIHSHEKFILDHHRTVNQMLKDYSTSKMGVKLRKMIKQVGQNGSLTKYSPQKTITIQRSELLQFPIQNCSQIVKCHLSRSRHPNHITQLKNINFSKSLNTLKLLYNRLCYEMMQQNYQKKNHRKLLTKESFENKKVRISQKNQDQTDFLFLTKQQQAKMN